MSVSLLCKINVCLFGSIIRVIRHCFLKSHGREGGARSSRAGSWLNEWCHVQGELTAELCSGEDAARAVGLIDQYFPKKKYAVRYEKKDGISVLLKKPKTRTVKRDSRKTWRFFKACDVESQGVFAKIKYFKDNKITHGPPIHDDVPCSGLMDMDDRKKLAAKLTKYVRSEVPAYSRALVKCEKIVTCTFEDGVKSDKEAAERVYKLCPYWKSCGGELYVLDDQTGMWDCTYAAHSKIISRFSDNLMKYREITDDGDLQLKLSQITSYGNTLDLMNKLPPFIAMLCQDDDWVKNTGKSSFHKLLYKNGWYDGKTGVFHKEFDTEIVFHKRIDRDYNVPDEDDEAYMADIEKRLFTIPLGLGVGNYLLTNLSRGLFADTLEDGVFIMGLGNTRSGKGIITAAFINSCGDYCTTWTGENLKVKNGGQNGTDEAACQRWMLKMQHNRLVFSNELNSNIDIDGNMLKKMTGRGDYLVGRDHYKGETEFLPHFTPVLFAQDCPTILPLDDAVLNRVHVISFNKTFVSGTCTNMFELSGDDNLKKELDTPRFHRAFLMLATKKYRDYVELKAGGGTLAVPREVEDAKKNWLNSEDGSAVAKFLVDFELTNNANDCTPNKVIKEWLDIKRVGVSINKLTSELKKHCMIQGAALSNCKGGQSKRDPSGGRQVFKGWTGIKKHETEEDRRRNEQRMNY
jgi:hypothetical protein